MQTQTTALPASPLVPSPPPSGAGASASKRDEQPAPIHEDKAMPEFELYDDVACTD